MMILNGYYSFLTLLSRLPSWPLFLVLLLPALLFVRPTVAQSVTDESNPVIVATPHEVFSFDIRPGSSPRNPFSDPYLQRLMSSMQDTTGQPEELERQTWPDPNSVMLKSVMIPGWGQTVNRQAWKIPIIYGIFGGLGYAIHEMTKRYHGYRAAYYNLERGDESDFRFGPTPSYVPENVSLQQLRDARNSARNQRDIMYLIMGAAYGLNIVDAYVYAHMRSFDVSDDLSANTTIGPSIGPSGFDGLAAGFRLQIQLKPHR